MYLLSYIRGILSIVLFYWFCSALEGAFILPNMHGNTLILSALLCLKIYLVPAQALAAGWIWDSVPAPYLSLPLPLFRSGRLYFLANSATVFGVFGVS